MQPAHHEPARRELPRALIHGVAVTVGTLAALAVLISLGRAGIGLADVWHGLFSAQALQLRVAGALWLIAGAAFFAGAATAWALARFPPPWERLRLLRWVVATLGVLVLADIGHAAAAPVGAAPGIHVLASLVALCAAALMAAAGAYFTARR